MFIFVFVCNNSESNNKYNRLFNRFDSDMQRLRNGFSVHSHVTHYNHIILPGRIDSHQMTSFIGSPLHFAYCDRCFNNKFNERLKNFINTRLVKVLSIIKCNHKTFAFDWTPYRCTLHDVLVTFLSYITFFHVNHIWSSAQSVLRLLVFTTLVYGSMCSTHRINHSRAWDRLNSDRNEHEKKTENTTNSNNGNTHKSNSIVYISRDSILFPSFASTLLFFVALHLINRVYYLHSHSPPNKTNQAQYKPQINANMNDAEYK